MIPKAKVKEIVSKHSTLEKELSSGNIDSKNYAKKSKEYSDLGNIVDIAKDYLKFDDDKNGLEQILNDKKSDKEMISLAEKELSNLLKKKELNEKKLKIFLLPKDSDDQKNAILERIPMKKLGDSSDIAKAVGFLCSENANYITGQTLHVNGGLALI